MPVTEHHEFIDDKGRLWVVRPCTEEEGCTVIEKFNRHGQEEPVQCMDVPDDVRVELLRILAEDDGETK